MSESGEEKQMGVFLSHTEKTARRGRKNFLRRNFPFFRNCPRTVGGKLGFDGEVRYPTDPNCRLCSAPNFFPRHYNPELQFTRLARLSRNWSSDTFHRLLLWQFIRNGWHINKPRLGDWTVQLTKKSSLSFTVSNLNMKGTARSAHTYWVGGKTELTNPDSPHYSALIFPSLFSLSCRFSRFSRSFSGVLSSAPRPDALVHVWLCVLRVSM